VTGRWANLALGALVPLATLSGFGLFLVGSGPLWLVAVLHGGLGLGLLVLVPWKHAVVRRGLRRVTRPGRGLSIALTWLLAAALLSGLAEVAGLTAGSLPVTTLQVHVGVALVATALTLVHAGQRPTRVRRADWGRRTLLRSGAVLAVAGVAGIGAQGVAGALDREGRRRATGSFRLPSGSVDAIPVTQWLVDGVPVVDPAAWRLTVIGPTGERRWTAAELGRSDALTAVLDCTGGWWTEQEWAGVRVSRLLPGAVAGATVLVPSATGYARRLPLTDDLLLATAVGGQPLSRGHGAPARLGVPGRRGYHWVKWVVRIETVDGPWWAQPPLPLH
jgi:DMSO/TMAO reductase YedYZ molybdopterin-dependent catalytic subunit